MTIWPGRVDVGHAADAARLLARGGADGLGVVDLAAQRGQPGGMRLAGLLHAEAALAHQHQRVAERQGARDVQGGELAQGEAERRARGRRAAAGRSRRAPRRSRRRRPGWRAAGGRSGPAPRPGPSRQTPRRSRPRTSDASSKTRRAAAQRSATSTPMPTFWAPWPGQRIARLIASLLRRREARAVAASSSTVRSPTWWASYARTARTAFRKARASLRPWPIRYGALDAEQRRAAVLRVVRRARRGRPSTSAGRPPRCTASLSAREQVLRHALGRLQHHVAGEAVGDDDVGLVLEELARLDVADEGRHAALAEQGPRLVDELVALVLLLADREDADARLGDAERGARVEPRHDGVLEEVLGRGSPGSRPPSTTIVAPPGRGNGHRDAGPAHARQPADSRAARPPRPRRSSPCSRRPRPRRRAAARRRRARCCACCARTALTGSSPIAATWSAALDAADGSAARRVAPRRSSSASSGGLDADEHDLDVREGVEGAQRSLDRRGRGPVSSHGVDGDAHASQPAPRTRRRRVRVETSPPSR